MIGAGYREADSSNILYPDIRVGIQEMKDMDREKAIREFDAYVSRYHAEDPMIRLKILHTYRVADIAEEIAQSLHLEDKEIDLAWFLGILHDIGRFEQIQRYRTFVDSKSVDHAEFGADLLFDQGLIETFHADGLPQDWRDISEKAIRSHNKLALPEGMDERTMFFSHILRDADKVDIFRVIMESPSVEHSVIRGNPKEEEGASEKIMESVMAHRCIPRDIRRSDFEVRVSHCCMAFELVYPRSRELALQQGYLQKMLRATEENGSCNWNPVQRGQMEVVRREIERAWGMRV